MDEKTTRLWWAAHDAFINIRDAGLDRDEETGEMHPDLKELKEALDATDPDPFEESFI